MTVTFNYTGRVDIDDSHVVGDLRESEGKHVADVAWTLSSYDFPKTARVEIYFQGVYDQIIHSAGEVGLGDGSASIDLSTLRKPLEATITLKVVIKDARGIPILLGLLTRYRPNQNGSPAMEHSILLTQCDPTLKVPWRVVTSSGRPVLHITDELDLFGKLTGSGIFMQTVIPSVLEAAFNWLIWETDIERDVESVEDWKSLFVQLEIDASRIDEWIAEEKPEYEDIQNASTALSSAAEKFAERHGLLATLSTYFSEES